MFKPYLPRVMRTERAEFVLELIGAAALGASAVWHWWPL